MKFHNDYTDDSTTQYYLYYHMSNFLLGSYLYIYGHPAFPPEELIISLTLMCGL